MCLTSLLRSAPRRGQVQTAVSVHCRMERAATTIAAPTEMQAMATTLRRNSETILRGCPATTTRTRRCRTWCWRSSQRCGKQSALDRHRVDDNGQHRMNAATRQQLPLGQLWPSVRVTCTPRAREASREVVGACSSICMFQGRECALDSCSLQLYGASVALPCSKSAVAAESAYIADRRCIAAKTSGSAI